MSSKLSYYREFTPEGHVALVRKMDLRKEYTEEYRPNSTPEHYDFATVTIEELWDESYQPPQAEHKYKTAKREAIHDPLLVHLIAGTPLRQIPALTRLGHQSYHYGNQYIQLHEEVRRQVSALEREAIG